MSPNLQQNDVSAGSANPHLGLAYDYMTPGINLHRLPGKVLASMRENIHSMAGASRHRNNWGIAVGESGHTYRASTPG